MSDGVGIVILAAGKGTRMKSDLVKVLHPIMGQPMLAHVLNSARYLKPERTVVVVGHQAERVAAAFQAEDLVFVCQEKQLGTGHAVAVAEPALRDFDGIVLILYGDVPLLSPQTLMDFMAAHRQTRVDMSVLTVAMPDPGAYGRIIRDGAGFLQRIVEARDATADELAVTEINAGIYAVDARLLFEAVGGLTPDNDQGEYYLTDVAAYMRSRGRPVAAIMCPDPEEVLGINDRCQLARTVAVLKDRINRSWMRAGVTMIDPMTTYIETTVKLSGDVTLWPGVCLTGRTTVGPGAVIGPDCQLTDAVIGSGAVIEKGCYISGVEIPNGGSVGPLSVLGHSFAE